MPHSTITSKGQTTIPNQIRNALHIKPGDRLEYHLTGDQLTIRVHPGAKSLQGALASTKGHNLTLTQIRQAAATAARRQRAK